MYLHWSVLAVALLLVLISFQSPIHAVVAVSAYLGVIVIHEIGHAWVARRLGYDVYAIRVAFLHGYCEYDAPHTQADEVLIAWGGVVAQLAIAAPILIVAVTFENQDFGYAAPVIVFLGYLNVLIALVNLAPAPGFDGAIAWRAVPLLRRWWSARRIAGRAVARRTRRR